MATITLKGKPVRTVGELPKLGTVAPDFRLVRQDLSEVTLATFVGKKKILNIFPSIDTSVCATSVKTFHQQTITLPDIVVLNISADLPFAQKRFCGTNGVEHAETLSTFRSTFGKDWGVGIIDSPLKGLCSRAVVVLDQNNRILYTEQVPEIAQEPNYETALAAVKR